MLGNTNSGLTQLEYNGFPYDASFQNLNIYSDPDLPTAYVVIDGQEILSVGKVDGNSAGERAKAIREELLDAIKSEDFQRVVVEEKGQLPVLYLNFQKSSERIKY